MSKFDMSKRLEALRHEMRAHEVDYYLVPSSDAHQSEYVPEFWQRRAYISGFTGSAGGVLVGKDKAYLWTDGRYWLQAEKQLDEKAFVLMRQGMNDTPSKAEFLLAKGESLRVGYDPMLHTLDEMAAFRQDFLGTQVTLCPLENLIDKIWEEDRPLEPASKVWPWDERYAGQKTEEKLQKIRAGLQEKGASHLVVSTLDELAYVFDIRGKDVDYNPVTIAWGLVSLDAAQLFIRETKLSQEAKDHLAKAGVEVLPYTAFGECLSSLEGLVLLDPSTCNEWILTQVEASKAAEVKLSMSPVQLARAVKTEAEQVGMRRSHVRDGAALVRYLAWLESHYDGLDEWSASERLEEFRKEGELFQGLSFDTISGFGPNGAIVHYRVEKESALPLNDKAIYLVDSGGQYQDGTTDVTRTVHFGSPKAIEKRHYTLVLKGHLALGRAVFPKGTTGTHLDVLARHFLWAEGLNYSHGTGHGVGCYLSVHQGPHRVSPQWNSVALLPGMVLSNEPGYYPSGEYGIRIENLVLVKEDIPKSKEAPSGPFYAFEDLTCAPYCQRLIDEKLLTEEEKAQINHYHAWVRKSLQPFLEGQDEEAWAWLERETKAIG